MEAAAEDTQKESTENVLPNNSTGDKVPTPQPETFKKSKKEDRTKKDDKNVEQFMKSLNSVPTLEEKLSMVCKKYVQTADDNKKLQFYIKQSDKRHALLAKEKEQLQFEFNKTILLKSKLENLCRELQKQNKAIKEESLLKIREEEERRKETQAKFQNTLSEITTLLQQNNEKNAKLRDDNISMTEKFKSVVQQYQLREQQVDKMAKQMSLESQLSDAKLQKASLEHQADRERLMTEMEQVKVTLAQYRAKIMELQGTETSLRSQLSVYTDKYDEFQNALVKSNQMFGGFKEQMEKMSKKIKKLEKESLSWKSRWESSQTALLDMCGERQASEERAAAAARQLAHMQGLCRTLQAERTVLLGTLKENNIERPPLPTPPPAAPAPAPPAHQPPANNAKVDAMAANCVQLRQSLAHLQTQLNVLTNKQQTKEEPPKPEKTKKSKSKKNKAQKSEIPETPKEESDGSAAKELPDEGQPNVEDISLETEKVDNETMENLIQAINNANINLCDLEINNEDASEDTSLKENDTEIKGVKTEIVISNETVLIPENTTVNETNDKNSKDSIKTSIFNESENSSTVESQLLKEPKDVKTEIVTANETVKSAAIIETNSSQVIEVNEQPSKVVTKEVDDTLNSLDGVTEVISKLETVSKECHNSSIVSTNEEVSHINEVKPILNA